MGLFSRNRNRDRVSVEELGYCLQANGFRVTTCHDDGDIAHLIAYGQDLRVTVRYQKDITVAMMEYPSLEINGTYNAQQLEKIAAQALGASGIVPAITVLGNEITILLTIKLMHRFFSLDEFVDTLKNLKQYGSKVGYELVERGILRI